MLKSIVSHRHRRTMAVCLCTLLAPAPVTARQVQERPWAIEFTVGGLAGTGMTDGTSGVFEPGVPFQAFTITSRRVSSFYFGDGARILEDTVASLRRISLFRVPDATPLDPVLLTAALRRDHGVSLGARLSRRLWPRISAEIDLSHHAGRLTYLPEALDTIEASRVGVGSPFQIIMVNSSVVTSTAAVRDRQGTETTAVGGFSFDLTNGRMVPYLTTGVGIIWRTGDMPGLTMHAAYDADDIHQTDSITVRHELRRHDWTVTAGGGLRLALHERWVARIEIKDVVSSNSLRTLVDAEPNPGVPGRFGTAFSFPGGLVFSGVTAVPSTLSGPVLKNYETFSGKGLQHRIGVTTGVGWRF